MAIKQLYYSKALIILFLFNAFFLANIGVARATKLASSCDDVIEYKPATFSNRIFSAYLNKHCEIDLVEKSSFSSERISQLWLSYIMSADEKVLNDKGSLDGGGYHYAFDTQRTVSNPLFTATTEATEELTYSASQMFYKNESVKIHGSGVSNLAKATAVQVKIFLKQRPNGNWYIAYDTYTSGSVYQPAYLPFANFKNLVLDQIRSEVKRSVDGILQLILETL